VQTLVGCGQWAGNDGFLFHRCGITVPFFFTTDRTTFFLSDLYCWCPQSVSQIKYISQLKQNVPIIVSSVVIAKSLNLLALHVTRIFGALALFN